MKPPLLTALETAILERLCAVERRESDWTFVFGTSRHDGCVLTISSLWRIVSHGHVVHAVDDDGQQFGLPSPVDGEHRARSLVGGQPASLVVVDEGTSDLAIHFGPELRLEVITSSYGYESWQAYYEHLGNEIALIGHGQGLSFTKKPLGSNAQVLVGRPLTPSSGLS